MERTRRTREMREDSNRGSRRTNRREFMREDVEAKKSWDTVRNPVTIIVAESVQLKDKSGAQYLVNAGDVLTYKG